jgi:hypothetical protein
VDNEVNPIKELLNELQLEISRTEILNHSDDIYVDSIRDCITKIVCFTIPNYTVDKIIDLSECEFTNMIMWLKHNMFNQDRKYADYVYNYILGLDKAIKIINNLRERLELEQMRKIMQ